MDSSKGSLQPISRAGGRLSPEPVSSWPYQPAVMGEEVVTQFFGSKGENKEI